MGRLFDQNHKLFDGLIYTRDVYDARPGCDPELICRGLEPITEIEHAICLASTRSDPERD